MVGFRDASLSSFKSIQIFGRLMQWVTFASLSEVLHTPLWRDLESRQVTRPLGFRWFRCTRHQRHQKPCKRRRSGAIRAILKVLQSSSHQDHDVQRWSFSVSVVARHSSAAHEAARSPSRDDRDVRKGTVRPYSVWRETCLWCARRGHRWNGEPRTNVDGEQMQTQEERQPRIA